MYVRIICFIILYGMGYEYVLGRSNPENAFTGSDFQLVLLGLTTSAYQSINSRPVIVTLSTKQILLAISKRYQNRMPCRLTICVAKSSDPAGPTKYRIIKSHPA